MTELSREILENWQIRKTRKQKTAFIDWFCSHFPEAVVEEGGRSRNIVIGDVEQADVVLTAHYDTCAVLPFPNVVMPQSVLLSILYAVAIVVPVVAIALFAMSEVLYLTDSILLGAFVYIGLMLSFVGWMFLGKPNPHTANDNTSGVITLVELLQNLTGEQRSRVAFVLFDNEENGLLGSGQFKKRHKDVMQHKLLLNFDCVSDGDTIALVYPRRMPVQQVERLREAFDGIESKRLLLGSDKKLFYPSDQKHFPLGVGVAALKGKRLLYLNRIHTARDTVFDEENIRCLCRGVERLLTTE